MCNPAAAPPRLSASQNSRWHVLGDDAHERLICRSPLTGLCPLGPSELLPERQGCRQGRGAGGLAGWHRQWHLKLRDQFLESREGGREGRKDVHLPS
ncbi:unnamed protein product [Rangifer tarandus platyrhynchus]|uniref:Uncharacterized protein n=2 Tax=Rangifer tarandus platyrhynchus TaxID=3082113 RepID=A0ACB0F853_RANTA|nr:unnamed protein product [Rangifer tarandus platyrhynchus]CAI9709235.1 unnamed protein product [Rangifer tarandus platyrhynchus]